MLIVSVMTTLKLSVLNLADLHGMPPIEVMNVSEELMQSVNESVGVLNGFSVFLNG